MHHWTLTFLQSLVEICSVVSQKKMKMWNSHRVQCKILFRDGGHFEFPIGKQIPSWAQEHLTIISAKYQLNPHCSFWQEDFLNLDQSEYRIGPGGHLEISIGTNFTNLVKDFLLNISVKICWNLLNGFKRRWICEIPIGSNVKLAMFRHGSHFEFLIGKRFTSRVQDHLIIISTKYQFNRHCSFDKKIFEIWTNQNT